MFNSLLLSSANCCVLKFSQQSRESWPWEQKNMRKHGEKQLWIYRNVIIKEMVFPFTKGMEALEVPHNSYEMLKEEACWQLQPKGAFTKNMKMWSCFFGGSGGEGVLFFNLSNNFNFPWFEMFWYFDSSIVIHFNLKTKCDLHTSDSWRMLFVIKIVCFKLFLFLLNCIKTNNRI